MSKQWTQSTSIPYDFYAGEVVVYNNKIHLLGCNNYKKYHYSWNNESFVSESTLPYNFYYGGAVVYDNKIHILGSSDSSTSLRKAHYSWNGTTWSQESTLPYEFRSGDAIVYNNKIHIMGGVGDKTAHYSWDGTSWTQESTLPYNFSGQTQSAVVYNNKIHIFGGASTSSTDHYSWDGTSWVEESTLPYAFYASSAIVYNNKIHILGGYQNVNKHYSWDGSSWSAEPSCPFECYITSIALYQDNIHSFGGYNSYVREHYYYSASKDYNKVIYGNKTLIDLTSDTVAPEYLLQGYTAHSKTGEIIEGTYSGKKVIVGTQTGSSGKQFEVTCDFYPAIIAIWNETKRRDSNYSNTAVKIPGIDADQRFFYSEDSTSDATYMRSTAMTNSPSISYTQSGNIYTIKFSLPTNSPWYVGTYKYVISEE